MMLKRLALGAAVFSLVVGCATFTALGDGQYSGYPAYGDYHWRAPVATTAKLPSSGNFTGDARIVLSPISVYYWTGSTWLSLIPASVVSGVVSATDNALVRWDGTTGTAIQNSTATLSDTGLLSTSNLLVSGLTASTVPYLDASKQLTSSSVTPTQLGYLDATSSIQTQLNGKQANGNYITALTGDVTAAGPGSSSATVATVGGKTAAAVSGSVDATSAATSSNTASTIVKRDASGNFSAGTITANLTGNASSFTGPLSGDVTGTQSATVVSSVGGKTSSAVATSTSATEAATNSNTASTIVKRDASGNFSAGTISAALTGNSSTATALAANPTDCAAGNMATTIDANGNLTCAQVSDSYIASGAAISRSKIASGTANHVVINDSSGNLSSVAPSTAGNVLTSNGTSWASSSLKLTNDVQNVALSASISSSTLVVALKQSDGTTDCSSSAPCIIPRRDATVTNAYGTTDSVTAAMSVTAGTTDSLGNASGAGAIVYVYFISDTTSELCLTRTQRDESALHSATAFSASAETSNSTLYCPSAHTSKPIRLLGRVTASWSNPNWSSITEASLFGPNTVVPLEIVAARYNTTNNQGVSTNGTSVITTLTKVYDTHGIMNASTGVATIPVSGTYSIEANFVSASTAWTTANNRYVQIQATGTQTITMGAVAIWASVTQYLGVGGSTTLRLNAGDTLSVSISNWSGSTFTLNQAAAENWVSIERIGN